MNTVAEIIAREKYTEMAENNPEDVIAHIDKHYNSQRVEIVKHILDERFGSGQVDNLVKVHQMVGKMAAELRGLLDAHELVGKSPVISKNSPTECGRDLYNACARYVSVYNKEHLL